MRIIKLKDTPDSKIMIRAANWIGDAIMTTPVIRAVRKNYPLSQISVLAKPWVIPVYENNPNIDHMIVYEDKETYPKGIGTLRLAKDLRKYRFDLAVLMQNAFEAGLISFLAGIKERLGFNTDGRGLLLNRGIKLDRMLKKGHLIDYYIGILKGAGLFDAGRKLDLFLSESDRRFAEQFLIQEGFDPARPVIGINPGATGGTAKRWFPERYAEFCRKLAGEFNLRIMIFGGPADFDLGGYIAELARGCCVNISGRTTLGQAFALIERCSLFVTNDSGLMHAAAALDINQVAVIGSTDYVATAPSNKNSRMVRVPLECSPCLKDRCPLGHHRCMKDISVDRVWSECRHFLENHEKTI